MVKLQGTVPHVWFGMAKGVREAMEEVMRAAEQHTRHEGGTRTLTFRPPAFD